MVTLPHVVVSLPRNWPLAAPSEKQKTATAPPPLEAQKLARATCTKNINVHRIDYAKLKILTGATSRCTAVVCSAGGERRKRPYTHARLFSLAYGALLCSSRHVRARVHRQLQTENKNTKRRTIPVHLQLYRSTIHQDLRQGPPIKYHRTRHFPARRRGPGSDLEETPATPSLLPLCLLIDVPYPRSCSNLYEIVNAVNNSARRALT